MKKIREKQSFLRVEKGIKQHWVELRAKEGAFFADVDGYHEAVSPLESTTDNCLGRGGKREVESMKYGSQSFTSWAALDFDSPR